MKVADEDPETVRLSDQLVALLASTHDPSPPGDLLAAVTAKIAALEAEPWAPLGLIVPELDPAFFAKIMGRIEVLEADALPVSIRDAIAREASIDRDLVLPVMARIEAEIELELASEGGPMLGEVRAELARESERMQTERVVSEVSAELRSIGPRLEREMPRAVAARIEAKPSNVIPMRRHWVAKTAAGVMAAAAAMMIYLRPVDPELGPTMGLPPLDLAGEVHVDAVSFDGTVTVTEADGVAVIWLTDDLAT
mgnify:CR=1 FL=1